MAELSRSAPADRSRIAVLGASLKMEVVELEPASGAAVSDGDTFQSRLVNPQFGFLFANGDNAGDGQTTLTTVTDNKEVTINVNSGSFENDLTVVAVVFGN